MATTHPTAERSTDPRPNYFQLGIDERGARHVCDTKTETVHIVHPDGLRGRRHLNGGTLDDYMDAVRDAYGWQREDYGQDCVEILVEELGGVVA